jgi:hypothetical protein
MDTKVCTKCGIDCPIDYYPQITRTNKSGIQRSWRENVCKICQNERRKAQYPKHAKKLIEYGKEYQRTHLLQIKNRKYDIDYNAMLVNQNYMCNICAKPHSIEPHKGLYVDHDHTTGQVRALICQACNTILGQAQDSIEHLEKAIAYLKLHSNKK